MTTPANPYSPKELAQVWGVNTQTVTQYQCPFMSMNGA